MSKVFHKIILILFPISIILILWSPPLMSLKEFLEGGLQVLQPLVPSKGQEGGCDGSWHSAQQGLRQLPRTFYLLCP